MNMKIEMNVNSAKSMPYPRAEIITAIDIALSEVNLEKEQDKAPICHRGEIVGYILVG
jgi:hypothetical protein